MITVSAHRQGTSPRTTERGLRGFATRYGWRAYALPILALLTVAVLVQQGGASGGSPATAAGGAGAAHQAGFAGFSGQRRDEGGPDQTSDAAPDPVTLRTDVESDTCAGNEFPQLVVVSLNKQHAWMCEKQKQVYATAVTTGATTGNDQTPTGSWRVQSRERDRYLVGPGYRDYVHYWVPFNGDFGFHDATWQTMAFGSPGYKSQGSHGCVHLPMPAMRWFYAWSQVNETVVNVEA
jgi:lipoprotein-anchoring transpeptidase ErfK/SrfK